MEEKKYYLGLDIGTDSVGYACTDEEYNLLKFHGEPAWGSHIFDEGNLQAERRSFRSARRRLDRRQQRVTLVQELFAKEIGKIDPKFFIRIHESELFGEDKTPNTGKHVFFNDENYTDKEYYAQYPTIHHLIVDLMKNDAPHDVRLVYIACAWLVAHRGHFLKNIDKDNLSEIKDFAGIYKEFTLFFEDNGYTLPWSLDDGEIINLGNALKSSKSISVKQKEIAEILLKGKKAEKIGTEGFPFSTEAVINLLAGGTRKVKDVFCNEEYEEAGSVSLGMDDDKLGEIAANIEDDFALIEEMRKVYDWTLLVDTLGNSQTISEAKVAEYEQHKKDLAFLKKFVKNHIPEKYNEIFREIGKDNYVAYSYHSDENVEKKQKLKKKGIEDFSKYIKNIVKDIAPNDEELDAYNDMMARLEVCAFMPKQKNTNNRVIPYQLYWFEMEKILNNAEKYLPFLSEKEDNRSVTEKLLSIITFRVPYFVGPLNKHSDYAWIVRKEGKITPWNFNELVDLDESENAFINKLTNKCTYLPDCDVLPKDSLCYHKFMVLNEINNLKINDQRISVEHKQKIYNELFLNKKKVTTKDIEKFFDAEMGIDKERKISGIDITIKSNLVPQIAFRNLLESKIISEEDAERIIQRSTYAEDKTRLAKWLEREYPNISETDRKYICRLKFKDFGRLSGELLCEIEGVCKETGELTTIMGALWNTQYNFMEIIESDKFTFKNVIDEYRKDYYSKNKFTLEDKMDEMYLSNAVKRSVYRTLDIVGDVRKAFGAPAKIFIETTRGGKEDQKGQRTKSRKEQIIDLYKECRDQDVRELQKQLDDMGVAADNRLQGDKLFLYFIQLGKCMYSGERIDLEQLGSDKYNIDHIYPQAFKKDDSIINNKVLVLSTINGNKKDVYPIDSSIRSKMNAFWKYLHSIKAISDEKLKRLERKTPFTEEEKLEFINRQLTETSQSAVAVANLLKERFSDTEIIYCKAGLVHDFRNIDVENMVKSRTFNDLHHAKDAYLNIVTGDVYSKKFTKNFNVNEQYTVNPEKIFKNKQYSNGKIIWNPDEMLPKVKKILAKNNAHFTKFAFFKNGGLFDQMPVKASDGLTPLKNGKKTEKYGGYNKSSTSFFIPVRYYLGKKKEVIIMSVEMLAGDRFLKDEAYAKEYSIERLKHIIGKTVEKVEFPMGMRPWKVNTVLSLDGFKACITASGGKGKCLSMQGMMQFSEDQKWNFYLKKIERFVEKCNKNPKYLYDIEEDIISAEKNMEMYDLYLKKLSDSIFSKRINNPIEILRKGREEFFKLDIKEQAKTIMNIHSIFGRLASGCDLSNIGGSPRCAATVNFSTTISNWKKSYKDVRLIDTSASGLWEKTSENLFDLL